MYFSSPIFPCQGITYHDRLLLIQKQQARVWLTVWLLYSSLFGSLYGLLFGKTRGKSRCTSTQKNSIQTHDVYPSI